MKAALIFICLLGSAPNAAAQHTQTQSSDAHECLLTAALSSEFGRQMRACTLDYADYRTARVTAASGVDRMRPASQSGGAAVRSDRQATMELGDPGTTTP